MASNLPQLSSKTRSDISTAIRDLERKLLALNTDDDELCRREMAFQFAHAAARCGLDLINQLSPTAAEYGHDPIVVTCICDDHPSAPDFTPVATCPSHGVAR